MADGGGSHCGEALKAQEKATMQSNKNWAPKAIAAAGAMGILLCAGGSSAATRGMVGSLGVQNPSVHAQFLFEGGPAVAGKKQGNFPPTIGFKTVQVAGTAPGTFVGRPVTLAANKLDFQGRQFRSFMGFPDVAQTTRTFMSVQNAATFMNGAGALAACPGPGCTNVGAGTAISFCPPVTVVTAPGNVGVPAGNWDCLVYNNPGAGNQPGRISINNDVGAPHFGGVLSVLRNISSNVWRRQIAPSTLDASDAQVERSWMSLMNQAWTPGRPNFQFTQVLGNNGPIVLARMNANNVVAETFGCANGVGTVGPGKNYLGFGNGPIVGPGGPVAGACGTDPGVNAPGQAWGFKMTTGTISGSDMGPAFSSKTALGTPFAPGTVMTPTPRPKVGFFFTRMGDDSVSGTGANAVRNIVLLGGSFASDPESVNIFNRVMSLRMRLQVPEPGVAAGVLVGASALLGFALRRR